MLYNLSVFLMCLTFWAARKRQELINMIKEGGFMSKARDTQKMVKKKAEKSLKEKRKEKKAKKVQKKLGDNF